MWRADWPRAGAVRRAARYEYVDLVSGALTKTFDIPDVPVLPTPGEFALAPNGTYAYVSCTQGGTIEVLNLKDWKLEERIRLTKGMDGMAWVPSAPN